MKKLLDSDWLRAVQLKSNTSAKSVITVQKAQYQCKLQIETLESDLQSTGTGVRAWKGIKKFHKPRITFEKFPRVSEVSEHFRTRPKISENFQNVSEDRFENFATFSEDFRQFPKISKMLDCYFKHFATNFRRFVGMFVFALSGAFSPSFPKNFQTFKKGDTNPYFLPASGNWSTVKFFHVCY